MESLDSKQIFFNKEIEEKKEKNKKKNMTSFVVGYTVVDFNIVLCVSKEKSGTGSKQLPCKHLCPELLCGGNKQVCCDYIIGGVKSEG